ncbi:phospholipase D-like domain-containing protein [Streptomyces vinaceus]|uniref:hypothetical protein n=1 Tax=Streptomyces vinaceus TaxID=1960 RepID=UPI0036758933
MSVEDLLKATGVKPGSFYSAFPGGMARLERCMTHALENAARRGRVRALLDCSGSAKLLVATCQGLMVVGKADPEEKLLRAIVDNAFLALA